jgi:sucrose-6-phosphate hydrolase SacC (GH32 family)
MEIHVEGSDVTFSRLEWSTIYVTARRGWINDVNGPLYLNGTYHLPFQHAPWRLADSGNIAEKYWGHVISKDLVHWKEIGPVRSFTKQGCCWSGSSQIDGSNTAGLVKDPLRGKDGRLKNPAVVAFANHGGFRLEDFVVGFSYSLDSGNTWANYPGNPVIPAHSLGNRDPHVLWYGDQANSANNHWALVLHSGGGEDYIFYTSKDLVHWERSGDFKCAGGSECPEKDINRICHALLF